MITHWLTRVDAAKRLGVKAVSLSTVAGYKAIRTTLAPRKKGVAGSTRKLFNKADVEKLRAKRGTPPAPKKRRRTPPILRVEPQKVCATEEGLLSSSSAVVEEVQRCIAKLKKLDKSIASVRVEIERYSKQMIDELPTLTPETVAALEAMR